MTEANAAAAAVQSLMLTAGSGMFKDKPAYWVRSVHDRLTPFSIVGALVEQYWNEHERNQWVRQFCIWLLSNRVGCERLYRTDKYGVVLADLGSSIESGRDAIKILQVGEQLMQLRANLETTDNTDNYEREALQAVIFVAAAAWLMSFPVQDNDAVGRLLGAAADRLACAHVGNVRPESTQWIKVEIGYFVQEMLDREVTRPEAHHFALAAAAYERAAQFGQNISR